MYHIYLSHPWKRRVSVLNNSFLYSKFQRIPKLKSKYKKGIITLKYLIAYSISGYKNINFPVKCLVNVLKCRHICNIVSRQRPQIIDSNTKHICFTYFHVFMTPITKLFKGYNQCLTSFCWFTIAISNYINILYTIF